jgi:hypothetical protein
MPPEDRLSKMPLDALHALVPRCGYGIAATAGRSLSIWYSALARDGMLRASAACPRRCRQHKRICLMLPIGVLR